MQTPHAGLRKYMDESRGTARVLKEVYHHIYRHKASSRQMIASDLGVSLPTVAQALRQLQDAGMIYNAGEFESTGGRKAICYKVEKQARVAVGVDITKAHLSVVLVDMGLNILDGIRIRILFEDTKSYYRRIAGLIEEILNRGGIDRRILLGVGVSLPALIDESKNQIKFVTVIPLPDKFYHILKEYIPYPLRLFNDANSAGWAERFIRGDNKPIIYLSLSNTVGGAIILNEVYPGSNWRGAEFGHMSVVPGGKRCYCGSRGCLDAYCSAGVLSDFTDGDLREFFREMKESDNKGYSSVFHEYMEHLAVAVNNLRMCFDCDVILGGTVGACMEEYIEEFREMTAKLSPFENNADYIEICTFRTEAAAAGAALYYIDAYAGNLSL